MTVAFKGYISMYVSMYDIRAVVNSQESWTFLTPGTLVVLSFYIWGCSILDGVGHCLFNYIGTVVPFREEIKYDRIEVRHIIIQNVVTQSERLDSSEHKTKKDRTYLCLLVGFPCSWCGLSPALYWLNWKGL